MIEVECHISIRKDGSCFLSPVKTGLLHEIKQNGSLSGAAKKLKISYQHAWTMIDEMPVQPRGAEGVEGIVELNPELVPGLADLEGFSHLILLYHFHLIAGPR